MALRMLMLRSAGGKMNSLLGLRWTHGAAAIPCPLDGLIECNMKFPPLVLPEDSNNDRKLDLASRVSHLVDPWNSWLSLRGRCLYFLGLVSPHKRGIRNGPKALKPTPVIIRCKSCGRVIENFFFFLSSFFQDWGGGRFLSVYSNSWN